MNNEKITIEIIIDQTLYADYMAWLEETKAACVHAHKEEHEFSYHIEFFLKSALRAIAIERALDKYK